VNDSGYGVNFNQTYPQSGGSGASMGPTPPSPQPTITSGLAKLHDVVGAIENATGVIESLLGLGTPPTPVSKDKDIPNITVLLIAALERLQPISNRLQKVAQSL